MRIKTRAEAIALWRSEELPHVKATYEQDGRPDYPARSESWCNWTDALCKDRIITAHQYETWACPRECGK